ncbi:unnamed protein product [Dracunculus medinensis]|uniref:G_PROTEIN_RECEP_F1_2 domain-containing protein n=1 Tax=Dracunculus medinensis TaxID=318479 RepID=A0A0N4U4E1_DRAME|nr:unnamed protein product [Dracunculus medinensis]
MEMVNETLNEDDDLMMTDESDIAMLARFYYCFMLACILIGLTGNSMVWVLIRSNRFLRKLPSNTYLLTLSAMSSLFLISLFTFWLEEVSNLEELASRAVNSRLIKLIISVRNIAMVFQEHLLVYRSALFCKSLTFVAHFCDFSSVWLIVLVGFERLVLLYRSSFVH